MLTAHSAHGVLSKLAPDVLASKSRRRTVACGACHPCTHTHTCQCDFGDRYPKLGKTTLEESRAATESAKTATTKHPNNAHLNQNSISAPIVERKIVLIRFAPGIAATTHPNEYG